MNAAGTLGFVPGKDGLSLGAFITNPISLYARKPAQGTRYMPYPGGFLLHTGYPNSGIKKAIRDFARAWAAAQTPIIVHLLVQNKSETTEMVARLEDVEGVAAIEVGLPPDVNPTETYRLASAALGEFPVILRLPFEAELDVVQSALDSGAAMISMASPRGSLLNSSGDLVSGRLYGPGILPLALRTIQRWADLGAVVIGAGGVYHPPDIAAMLKAGATAVQVGPAFWKREVEFLSEK